MHISVHIYSVSHFHFHRLVKNPLIALDLTFIFTESEPAAADIYSQFKRSIGPHACSNHAIFISIFINPLPIHHKDDVDIMQPKHIMLIILNLAKTYTNPIPILFDMNLEGKMTYLVYLLRSRRMYF
ncbi:hypothetical protein ACJX0J_011564, partial [Zea mays]